MNIIGSLADATASQQQPCIEGHYCPSGTFKPIPCPRGTYGIDGTTSYKSESNCRSCEGSTNKTMNKKTIIINLVKSTTFLNRNITFKK